MLLDRLIWHDIPWLVAAVRIAALVLCGVDVALLARLFITHRVGRMPVTAAVGFALTVSGVAVVQARRIGEDDLPVEAALILTGLAVSCWSLVGVVRVGLFRRR